LCTSLAKLEKCVNNCLLSEKEKKVEYKYQQNLKRAKADLEITASSNACSLDTGSSAGNWVWNLRLELGRRDGEDV
jgi:hypothetical protein